MKATGCPAQLLRLGQVGQDVDEAHDRAQDAERRGVAGADREHADARAVAALHGLDLELEDLLDRLGLEPVDHHLEAAPDERVLDLVDVRLEGQQALAAGALGEVDELVAQVDRVDVAAA